MILSYLGQKVEVHYRRDWQQARVQNVREPRIHDVESGIDRVIRLLKERPAAEGCWISWGAIRVCWMNRVRRRTRSRIKRPITGLTCCVMWRSA